MDSKRRKGKRCQDYSRPQLTKHENLKKITAVWQCSVVDTHQHQRGQGHQSHGDGYGYGHCKVR